MNRTIIGTIALGFLIAGCSADAGSSESESTGTMHAALSLPGPTHDVTAIAFKVVKDGEGCDAEALAESTVVLEAEGAPVNVQASGSGANHAFADGLFVLPPGNYHVCATPEQKDGTPSADCAVAEGTGSVFSSQTTEIAIVSQCDGVANGGLDTVVTLNDPPVIDDLDIAASKFITTCEQATVTVKASDVNGDALSYAWTIVSGPAGGSIVQNGATMTFGTNAPGDYELKVVVTDAQGGTAELTFPIHVQDGECGPKQCDGGQDKGTGSQWVVCDADQNAAWISANTWGTYHVDLICQQLGYDHAAQFGGNCGSVCGYCDGQTSCSQHGREIYDGAGNCGTDSLGREVCYTVTWQCVH